MDGSEARIPQRLSLLSTAAATITALSAVGANVVCFIHYAMAYLATLHFSDFFVEIFYPQTMRAMTARFDIVHFMPPFAIPTLVRRFGKPGTCHDNGRARLSKKVFRKYDNGPKFWSNRNIFCIDYRLCRIRRV